MITIKTEKEIKVMAEGARMLAGVVEKLKKQARPGITTNELDRLAESLILKLGAKCNFKGEDNFPSCICASVNEQIVHAVPSERVLKEGDILSLDLGLLWKGFHTDMAVTLPVGKISFEAQRLLRVTKKALSRGIKKSKAGNTFGDIGETIQRYVESQGFNVVRDLCGHGIGRKLHEDPQIPNYGKRHKGPKIKEGMVFCLEPMVTMGNCQIKKGKDGFSFETKDGSLSAHFEHMVAITKKGPFVLTKLP